MVVGTCHLEGSLLCVLGRSVWVQFFRGRVETRVLPALPCPGWCIIHGQQLQTWFGTFTHTCTAPQGMVVGTYCLQGRQPIPWERSPVSFGQISLGSVFQGKSWDKGPSSLALPRMVHHPWPAAPDMIWHIYLHLYCSLRDGGRDLPSWGESAVHFGQIGLGSVFQGKSWDKGPSSLALPRMVHHPWPAAPDVIWHIYSHLYCSSRDGGRDLLSWGR